MELFAAPQDDMILKEFPSESGILPEQADGDVQPGVEFFDPLLHRRILCLDEDVDVASLSC